LAKKLKIEKNVIMTGAIEYKKIMKYYAHADFFVSASKTEVHPMVGLEVVASGLPIVALSSVGYDDIVKNGYNGYLTAENERDYVKKIVHFLKSPALQREMSKNALEESKKYSVIAAAKNMVKAYEKAIELIKN
jgi:1,2-diacylglycerol 3-alpha-glucosyltransferase